MSKKTELINVLSAYKADYESIQKIITDIKQDMNYTEAGKKDKIEHILSRFEPNVRAYYDKAIAIIDSGLEALSVKWKQNSTGKLLDGEYQTGIANILKMLEMGVLKNKEDIQNIINAYKDDFITLATIKEMLSKSNNETLWECALLIPQDMREENKRLIGSLRENIRRYFNFSTVKNSLNAAYGIGMTYGDIPLGLDGSIQFITDRLGDNLELLV